MKQRILVLAPHTDDGELGAGGSIARWSAEGNEVHYMAFSAAEESVPKGLPRGILRTEVRRATRALGIKASHVRVLKYRVRRFSYERQEILEDLVRVRAEVDPDLVLLPSQADTHQDHQVIAQEGTRAFKTRKLLAYEMPWNNVRPFSANLFVSLSEAHVRKKVQALACYKSQSKRAYVDEEVVRAFARTRGVQVGREFAEAFEVVRWVID